jgi:hypothetical protein
MVKIVEDSDFYCSWEGIKMHYVLFNPKNNTFYAADRYFTDAVCTSISNAVEFLTKHDAKKTKIKEQLKDFEIRAVYLRMSRNEEKEI